MFLKRNKLKPYKYFKKTTKCNEEGVCAKSYEYSKNILAEIYPAGGKVQSEIYGDRIKYMLNMNIPNGYHICENDAIAYMSEEANYKIVSIKRWTHHSQLELEKI